MLSKLAVIGQVQGKRKVAIEHEVLANARVEENEEGTDDEAHVLVVGLVEFLFAFADFGVDGFGDELEVVEEAGLCLLGLRFFGGFEVEFA